MKNKLVFAAVLVLALGFVLAGCKTDAGGGGNSPDWYGTYEDDDLSITLTANSISGEYDISNISIRETRDIPQSGEGIIFSVTWAYVFEGDTKIGVIWMETMSMSNYSETEYSLTLGKDRWENSGSSTRYRIREDGCDASDMSNTYSFNGDKE
jgi:hypothetical protein